MAVENLPKPEIPPKEYWDDDRWAHEHYMELVKTYPDMWVAIVDKRVVSSGKDLKCVIEEATAKTGRKEFPTLLLERSARFY